eukprot:3092983-Rhodomonas_salina.2
MQVSTKLTTDFAAFRNKKTAISINSNCEPGFPGTIRYSTIEYRGTGTRKFSALSCEIITPYPGTKAPFRFGGEQQALV